MLVCARCTSAALRPPCHFTSGVAPSPLSSADLHYLFASTSSTGDWLPFAVRILVYYAYSTWATCFLSIFSPASRRRLSPLDTYATDRAPRRALSQHRREQHRGCSCMDAIDDNTIVRFDQLRPDPRRHPIEQYAYPNRRIRRHLQPCLPGAAPFAIAAPRSSRPATATFPARDAYA